MRTVEEIKADIAELKAVEEVDSLCTYDRLILENLEQELRTALTADIPLDRLEQICAAEKDGRVVLLNPEESPTSNDEKRPKCWYTDKPNGYFCLGYCRENDDEPIDVCKRCWWLDGNDDFRAEAEKALGKEQG